MPLKDRPATLSPLGYQTTGSTLLRKAWQGKWALVTGASAGIGQALAAELAASGVNLVLTARRRDRLEALAESFNIEFGIETRVLVADLEQPGAPGEIFSATESQGLQIDVLVNNAGFGYYGEFAKGDAGRQSAMVQVNCTAVVGITNLFLPGMIARKGGDILIVSSTAAYQPIAYLATYAATKVFDRFLAEALAEEVKRYGVRVSALCPGPTESEFGSVAGIQLERFGAAQKADIVARRALEGLIRGKHWVIPYFAGRAGVFAQRFLPRRLITGGLERALRPKF